MGFTVEDQYLSKWSEINKNMKHTLFSDVSRYRKEF